MCICVSVDGCVDVCFNPSDFPGAPMCINGNHSLSPLNQTRMHGYEYGDIIQTTFLRKSKKQN